MHPALQFISHYGYLVAIPIMIIEGPIITLVMGFLSSLGLFNIFLVIVLGVISDLISDAIYYWSGYHGGPKVLEKLKIPQIHENDPLQGLKERFEQHPGKIFFTVKVLTGLAHSTFVLAGVTRINYPRVLKYTIPGGIIWTAGLAFLGYYFGKNATHIHELITRTGIIMFSLLVIFLVYKFWFGKYIGRKYAVWKEQNDAN